jgi:hypothetical protein
LLAERTEQCRQLKPSSFISYYCEEGDWSGLNP